MVSYYNEIDPYAAQWLRNLIANKLIADGDVDERSICDVAAADFHGYTQCHFFAGIGVWSYALRLAGWPDNRPVWTGSCPCQPFSAAGKKGGFDDERHLWPVFHRLIAECQPPVVFGEQVASKDGLAWYDTVHTDMEGAGYAIGAADLCAAGVGAPHIRQRLWFTAERLGNADSPRHEGHGLQPLHGSGEGRRSVGGAAGSGATGGMGHHHHQGLEGQRSGHQAEAGWLGAFRPVAEAGELGGLEHAMRGGTGNDTGKGLGAEAEAHGEDGSVPGQRLRAGVEGSLRGMADAGSEGQHDEQGKLGEQEGTGQWRDQLVDGCGAGGRPSPTNGHWGSADWLHCRDGRWRPVEPGTFPLVNGAPARVGRLRAYGNAIIGQVAAEVIGAYLDARP